jgi:hypothetical protein
MWVVRPTSRVKGKKKKKKGGRGGVEGEVWPLGIAEPPHRPQGWLVLATPKTDFGGGLATWPHIYDLFFLETLK